MAFFYHSILAAKPEIAAAYLGEGVAQYDSFNAVWAGGHDIDGHIQQRLNALDIGAGIVGQLIQRLGTHCRLRPTWQLFIHWRDLAVVFTIKWRRNRLARSVAIVHAYLHGIQAVEHIQLRQAQAGYTVDTH